MEIVLIGLSVTTTFKFLNWQILETVEEKQTSKRRLPRAYQKEIEPYLYVYILMLADYYMTMRSLRVG
jgi:hypothetical protein